MDLKFCYILIIQVEKDQQMIIKLLNNTLFDKRLYDSRQKKYYLVDVKYYNTDDKLSKLGWFQL